MNPKDLVIIFSSVKLSVEIKASDQLEAPEEKTRDANDPVADNGYIV